jgi:hypothetical protein
MLISEMYLITEDSKGAAEGITEPTTIMKCKFCSREFLVPSLEAWVLPHACEATACKTAHDKEVAAAKLAYIKSGTADADIAAVKKALGN